MASLLHSSQPMNGDLRLAGHAHSATASVVNPEPGRRQELSDWPRSQFVLIPDDLFVSVGDGDYRFNLDTPYCD